MEQVQEKDLWNFVYWEEFSDIVYSQTLNSGDMVSKGAIQHQDVLHEIGDDGKTAYFTFKGPEDHYFYKFVKGNENYLLSKRFFNELPMVPTTWTDTKLKPADSTVWKFVDTYESFHIPEEKYHETLGDYLKQFNIVEHTNPSAWTILKCISIARGLKLAVCGTYHVGKNANYNLKACIQNNVISGMKNKTEAMFYKLCLFNDDLNIDEITTWTPKKIQEIEDRISTYGDQSTRDSKHALDANKKNEVIKNINSKSFVITFNPYDEKKHPKYFGDNMGHPGKITDRYPFIHIDGEVVAAPAMPVTGTERKVVEDNIEFFRRNASEFMYWRNNYYKHLHHYDRSSLCFFKDVRKMKNISPLIDVIDVMSISKEVFEYWIDFLNKANADYKRMENGLSIETAPQAFEEFVGEDM